MSRVNRTTYASYLRISLNQYEYVHGLIEEFGGRVKQFSQDLKHLDDWLIFFEMAKSQESEFAKAFVDLKLERR